jgi:hypothetical protein
MSIPVALERLHAEVGRFTRAPYLLTVTCEGRPHAVATNAAWRERELVARVGRRTAENAAQRPDVSLLWPPEEAGGYSLIVDGHARLEGEGDGALAVITPVRGVLHRPASAPVAEGSSCSADCVPLLR